MSKPDIQHLKPEAKSCAWFGSSSLEFLSTAMEIARARWWLLPHPEFIQSATLSLLVGAFSTLTFKVVIDKYVFITLLNPVFQLILCFSFVLLWLDDCLLFYACVFVFLVLVNCIFGVWFVVVLFFKYINLLVLVW